MAREQSTLVIHDGGLAGLVAAMMAPDPAGVVVWTPPTGSRLRTTAAPESEIVNALTSQAELLGWRETLVTGDARRGSGSPVGLSVDLLNAVAIAADRGCAAVVWPVLCGSDLDALYEVAERAQAITRLAWLDLPGGGEGLRGSAPAVVVQTPFADLTPAQLAEMASDLAAPVHMCPDAGAYPLTQHTA